MIIRVVTVVPEFKQELVDEVVRQPHRHRRSMKAGAEAEELLAVAQHGRDVLDGQLGGIL